MAQKREYRSAVRSRRMIRQAFLALLHEKPYEKITVTDIVNRADINRSTFYAHYTDVSGLVDSMMAEIIQEALSLAENMDIQSFFRNPKPFVSNLLEIGIKNVDIYKLSSNSELALQQTEKIKDAMIQRATSTMDLPEQVRQSSAFQIHIHFFIGGIINTYQQWVIGNLDCSAEEIVEQIATLITNNEKIYQEMVQ